MATVPLSLKPTTSPSSSLLELLPGLTRRTLVMGVVNVTPDSFSDDGNYLDPDAAVAHALRLVQDGADILDIGGESTRPGATPVSIDEEVRRVLPVIERLRKAGVMVPLSLDTTKSSVASAAAAAGANLINDISGGSLDPDMLAVVAALGVPFCLMHLPVPPRQMGWSQAGGTLPAEADVVEHVTNFLQERVQAAEAAGIRRDQLIVDPGFGFGKTVEQNLDLLRRLPELKERLKGLPLLIGTSRKSTISRVLGEAAEQADPQRLAGTAATVALSIVGGTDIVRVHDVAFMTRVAQMTDAIVRKCDQ